MNDAELSVFADRRYASVATTTSPAARNAPTSQDFDPRFTPYWPVPGRWGLGGGYGSLSGSTRTPEVIFRGYFAPFENVVSTKKAVHPDAGVGTRATHVFGPDGVSGVFV